ncbi:MAG: hypothetical protein FWG72_06215 [Oscillospiraceae bacterium]|nr:hypothetical protein [Oscillospiraceae bacterium]
MKSYIRQKTIYCGQRYREVDIFPYTDTQKYSSGKRPRAVKEKISEPKQRNLNDKNAKRYLTQLVNGNFTESDLHISLTYAPENLPRTVEDAERMAGNFIRRLKYHRGKQDLPPLKYILVTSYRDGADGTPARLHHHIIVNGGIDRDAIEDIWRKPRRKNQEKGERLGYINADRLQSENGTYAALTRYITNQSNGKKRWSSSHNLIRPAAKTNDSRYSRRKVEKLAKQPPPRSYWEKKYPGWTLTDDLYGAEYIYNDATGDWSIYLKLRRME